MASMLRAVGLGVCAVLAACDAASGTRTSPPAPSEAPSAASAGTSAGPVTGVVDGAAPTPSVDPAPILARHRLAVGGDAAIGAAARMRLRKTIREAGIEGTETLVIEDGRSRSEARFPILEADTIEVWDKKRLVVRGWNGDVRTQGPGDRQVSVTKLSLQTLAYLRDATTRIEGLPPHEDSGKTYDRLRITPEGGAPVEIWIGADGLAARWLFTSRGRPTTRTIDAHMRQGSLVLPKTVTKHDPITKEPSGETVTSVELLASSVDPKTFVSPAPKLDATFPKGASKVTMPAGLLRGSYLSATGSIAGRPAMFLLDTGASMTVIDEDFLAEAGIRSAGGATFGGGSIFKGVRFARVPEVDLGGLKVGSQVVLAIPLRKSAAFGLPVDGILGYDFWSRFVTSIDYPMGTMTFYKPGAGAFAPSADDVPVTFELEGTSVEIPVTVNGKRAGAFQLDTGNGGNCTIHRFEGSAALVPRGPNPLRFAHGISYGSSSAASFSTSADIGVGPFVYASAPIDLLDPDDPAGASTGGNGNLGITFLKAFVVTFDYATSTVYFNKKRAHRPASTFGTTGVTFTSGQGTSPDDVVVDEVAAGWPGDKAGLKAGDVLVAMNGAPVKKGGGPEAPVPGEVFRMKVRRGETILDVEVVAAAHP